MKHEESHDMDKKLVLQTKKINKERERKREQQDPCLKHWKSFSKTYKPDTRIIDILRIINGNYFLCKWIYCPNTSIWWYLLVSPLENSNIMPSHK